MEAFLDEINGDQVNIPVRRVATFHASQKLEIVADNSAIPGMLGIPEHVDVSDRNAGYQVTPPMRL
jgi:hypothetical protein